MTANLQHKNQLATNGVHEIWETADGAHHWYPIECKVKEFKPLRK